VIFFVINAESIAYSRFGSGPRFASGKSLSISILATRFLGFGRKLAGNFSTLSMMAVMDNRSRCLKRARKSSDVPTFGQNP
jgi:hypothetical protein